MDEFKRYDPNVITPIASTEPRIIEETVVVRRESSAGWWAVGILGALALVALIWMFTRPSASDEVEALRIAQAEAAAADAQAMAANAINQNRAADSDRLAIAQAEAMEARADAVRAAQEARAAEAAAAQPVVVERQTVVQPAPSGTAVIASTTPQP